MSTNLCISVTFLDALFHGKGDEDPEWPPSPMRLFQALLAGARTGARGVGWNDARANAFRWLGNRRAPLIIAPAARRATRLTLYVPNNEGDKKFDRQDRLTGKLAWPHRVSNGDTVHFVWPLENDAALEPCIKILCKEARNLLALGWGIDQVVGNGRVLTDSEVASLPGNRWRAWARRGSGVPTWRIPSSGSLENLERVHQSSTRRIRGKQYYPPVKVSEFDTVEYLSAATIPPRSYAVFELPKGVAFRQASTSGVGAMLRFVACRMAKADTHQFPGGSETYVAGHVQKQEGTPPRFSYLPLPTIGHEHADGLIRRLLIAEPFGGDGAHAQWAQDRLRNATLHDTDGNDCGILVDLWRPSSCPMIRKYVAEARTWCTVTPVILPGFDDGKRAKAERLLFAAVEHADLPVEALLEFAVRKAPFWPGSAHSRHYAVPTYLKRFPRWHVYLRFREKVPGPLAIGGGRHVGLGVFAISEEAAEQRHAPDGASRRR